MALAPLLSETLLAKHLPAVWTDLLRILRSTNLLAVKFILANLDAPQWRRLLALASPEQRKDLGNLLSIFATRHWDSNFREAATHLLEKLPVDPRADDRRNRSIASSKTLGMLELITPDRFFEGWRAVAREGARAVPTLDQAAFMKRVSEIMLHPIDDVEFSAANRVRGRAGATQSFIWPAHG
jgi:DMSO/TMAO reductase YedYZ molybdopterin-dependent catalytic subunit